MCHLEHRGNVLKLVAALAHAVQALILLGMTPWLESKERGMFDGGHIGLYRVATVYDAHGGLVENRILRSGELNIRALIVGFFLLSAVFGLLGTLCPTCGPLGVEYLGGGGPWLWRFGEYSVSASVMLLAIACEAGVRDVYTLECQFVLIWVTQGLGALAEWTQKVNQPWAWLFPHLAAWVTCLAAYAPVIDCFLLNVGQSEVSPPGFVRVIVFLEFALFVCFGLVQTVGLTRKGLILTKHIDSYYNLNYAKEMEAVDQTSELTYTVLSLTAKTLLAWIVLSPLIAA